MHADDHREAGPKSGEKIAAFDFVRPNPRQLRQLFLCRLGAPDTTPLRMQDGTLVQTISGDRFARNADDWRLYNAKVPEIVRQYSDDGYKVVIFRYHCRAATSYSCIVKGIIACHLSSRPALIVHALAEWWGTGILEHSKVAIEQRSLHLGS